MGDRLSWLERRETSPSERIPNERREKRAGGEVGVGFGLELVGRREREGGEEGKGTRSSERGATSFPLVVRSGDEPKLRTKTIKTRSIRPLPSCVRARVVPDCRER